MAILKQKGGKVMEDKLEVKHLPNDEAADQWLKEHEDYEEVEREQKSLLMLGKFVRLVAKKRIKRP